MQDFKHSKFEPLREFLDAIAIECPVDSLRIPHRIALSHSKRFDSKDEAIKILEKVINDCDSCIVYLEQIRDIYIDDSDKVVINEIVKQYIYSRRKILNLLRAWKKIGDIN